MQAQCESGPQMAAVALPLNSVATAPAVPAVRRRGRWRVLLEITVGFSGLVLASLAGEQVKTWLHLPVPGNVLGLFFLLLAFRLRVIPAKFMEEAANRVLYILPALFIPIYVFGIGQRQLWSQTSWILFPMLFIATAGLWIFVGHLSQRLLNRSV
jgi:holin-like protein